MDHVNFVLDLACHICIAMQHAAAAAGRGNKTQSSLRFWWDRVAAAWSYVRNNLVAWFTFESPFPPPPTTIAELRACNAIEGNAFRDATTFILQTPCAFHLLSLSLSLSLCITSRQPAASAISNPYTYREEDRIQPRQLCKPTRQLVLFCISVRSDSRCASRLKKNMIKIWSSRSSMSYNV